MITQVVRVASDTDDLDGGLRVEITVCRIPDVSFAPLPRAVDVPPDIREALQTWLDNMPDGPLKRKDESDG